MSYLTLREADPVRTELLVSDNTTKPQVFMLKARERRVAMSVMGNSSSSLEVNVKLGLQVPAVQR